MSALRNTLGFTLIVASSLMGSMQAYAGDGNPVIPDAIKPPAEATHLFHTKASGYQIYRCEAGSADTYYWALKAPDAILYDDNGKRFGTHYAGPSWQSQDGSHIVGALEEKISSPDDPNAVAWLLVKAKTHGGTGVFEKVTHVNRIATKGGQAPKGTCNSLRLGDEYRASYSTVYYFYGKP